MTLPISERVMRAVLARLQTIKVVNGYSTDAGDSAARMMPGQALDGLPAIALVETAEAPAGGAAGDLSDSMVIGLGIDVEVHGVPGAVDTPEWLGLAKADVKRALLGWARGLLGDPGRGVRDADGRIGELLYLGSDTANQPAGATTAAVTVKFSAKYREGYGDPTQQL